MYLDNNKYAYYIDQNNALYYYNWSSNGNTPVKISENVTKVSYNGNGFFYLVNDEELYYFDQTTHSNDNNRVYRHGNIDLTNVKLFKNFETLCIGTSGELFSLLNSTNVINSAHICTFYTDGFERELSVTDFVNQGPSHSYNKDDLRWRLAYDNNGKFYLFNAQKTINLSDDTQSPIYGKNIVKYACRVDSQRKKIYFALVDESNSYYVGKIDRNADIEAYRDYIHSDDSRLYDLGEVDKISLCPNGGSYFYLGRWSSGKNEYTYGIYSSGTIQEVLYEVAYGGWTSLYTVSPSVPSNYDSKYYLEKANVVSYIKNNQNFEYNANGEGFYVDENDMQLILRDGRTVYFKQENGMWLYNLAKKASSDERPPK